MARNEYTAQKIKWNIVDYEDIKVLKHKLEQKRERLKAIWEKMDVITREYDRLLKEIDDLVCKIKKHEREMNN